MKEGRSSQYKPLMLGEFLVKHNVLTETRLRQALKIQRDASLDREILNKLHGIMSRKDVATLIRRHRSHNESLSEALVSLGFLSEKSITLLRADEKAFLIPFEQILVEKGFVSEADMKKWLHKYQTQDFSFSEVSAILRKTVLFNGFSDEALMELAGHMRYKVYAPGEFLYRKGSVADYLYIIESGIVQLSLSSPEKDIEIYRLQSGDYCGLYGVLGDGISPENAMAILEAGVWRIDREKIISLINEKPDFAQKATSHLSLNIKGILRGMAGTESRVQTSNINTLLFGPQTYEHELAQSLVHEIFDKGHGNILVITSFDNPNWPDTAPATLENMKSIQPEIFVSGKKSTIHFIYWPGVDQIEDYEDLSFWIREKSKQYQSVVFLVNPGTINFRQFIMGISKKTATLVFSEFPEHIHFTKPVRDRVYLIPDKDPKKTHERFTQLKNICPIALSPTTFHPGKSKRACERLARYLVGKTIGLALGGGGARGMSHLGVMEVLEENNIEIDVIAGTSAGSILGATIATGTPLSQIKEYFFNNIMNAKPFGDYTIPVVSLLRGKRLSKPLRRFFDGKLTYDTEIPYLPVTARMKDGGEVIVKGVELWKACMASSAAPGFLPPVEYDGDHLLDGGIVDNVPAVALHDYGVDFIISVNISVDPAKTSYHPRRLPSILMRFIDLVVDQTVSKHKLYSDVEIRPKVDHYSVMQWEKSKEFIQAGREAAEKKIPELKFLLMHRDKDIK